jgi:hypothetical protein
VSRLAVLLKAVFSNPLYVGDIQLYFPVASPGILFLSGGYCRSQGQDNLEIEIQLSTTADIILLSTLSSDVHPNFYPTCV